MKAKYVQLRVRLGGFGDNDDVEKVIIGGRLLADTFTQEYADGWFDGVMEMAERLGYTVLSSSIDFDFKYPDVAG